MSDKDTKALTRPFSAFDEDPDIDAIVDHVSSGGTLAQYCKHNGLPFGATRSWIKAHEKRNLAYITAEAAREDWINQTLSTLITEILSFDPSTVEDDMGRILPVSQWPPAARAALVSVSTDKLTRELTGAKFTSKLDAIQLLGRHAAMFTQKPKNEAKERSLDDILDEVADLEAAEKEANNDDK